MSLLPRSLGSDFSPEWLPEDGVDPFPWITYLDGVSPLPTQETFTSFVQGAPVQSPLLGNELVPVITGGLTKQTTTSALMSNSPTWLAQRRQANIAAFLAGALIPAPAWAATTGYVAGNCVTLPSGQVVMCVVPGTSGSSAPAFSNAILSGRPLPDGGTTLSTVVITGTGGQFSCAAATLVAGQYVTMSGTLGGTGAITGYASPTTYMISATNGSTTFTLVNPLGGGAGGTAIVTTAGTPTGLTYTQQLIWYQVYHLNGAANPNVAPTVTLYASAAAAGLTETLLYQSGAPSALATVFGGLGTSFGFGGYFGPVTFANGTVAAGAFGNTTAGATGASPSGLNLSALYVYESYTADVEFYVCDSVIGLTFGGGFAIGLPIEVDGQLVQAAPQVSNTTAGQCLKIDYNGVVKRRRVRVPGSYALSFAGTFRGVALTTVGYIEATDSPLSDQMLLLGDSILFTTVCAGPAGAAPIQPVVSFGVLLGRYLGLSGVYNCGVGGYTQAASNQYTMPQLLTSPVNVTLFQAYAPNHVLIAAGFNDNLTPWSTVGPAALSSWQAVRAMLPNAKITITDGFSQAQGPSTVGITQAANLLALFNTWGDGNSRFVQSTSAAAATAWVQGTGTASSAIAAGNSCNFVSIDNVHCTPLGNNYQAYRMAQAIIHAWNGAY